MVPSPLMSDQKGQKGQEGQETRETHEPTDVSGAFEEKEIPGQTGTNEPDGSGESVRLAEGSEPSPSAPSAEFAGPGAAPKDKPAASSQPVHGSRGHKPFREDEELVVRLPGPGWGALLLLSAALALVISSGVYIVLNTQFLEVSKQLKELHLQSGHMGSTQEEMGRIWKQERVAVREQLQSLHQDRQQLLVEVESLENRMMALQTLPKVVRNQSMAGLLRDAAGQSAFLGSQVETEAQRETLESIQEMLQGLAWELAGEPR